MRSSTEIKAEYERVCQEGRDVAAQIADLESRLKAAKKRKDEIYGGFVSYGNDSGLLGSLKQQFAQAQLYEADAKSPKVRLGSRAHWDEYVVRKITAKQIRIVKQGETHEMICERDTGKTRWGSAIHPDDLARILEGVK